MHGFWTIHHPEPENISNWRDPQDRIKTAVLPDSKEKIMSQSLLSETGYLKEDEKMMEDDVTLEEELLKMEDNRVINPDHNLKDKEKRGEASKQDQEPARATERDNPRKRRHKNTSAKERIKKA